jgi:hypothetical protein
MLLPESAFGGLLIDRIVLRFDDADAFLNGMAAGALTFRAASRIERACLWVRRASPRSLKKARMRQPTNKMGRVDKGPGALRRKVKLVQALWNRNGRGAL